MVADHGSCSCYRNNCANATDRAIAVIKSFESKNDANGGYRNELFSTEARVTNNATIEDARRNEAHKVETLSARVLVGLLRKASKTLEELRDKTLYFPCWGEIDISEIVACPVKNSRQA